VYIYTIHIKVMCGIVGFLGKTCIESILLGLKLLQNRGYDSAGISYIESNKIKTVKFASTNTHNSLEKLESVIEKEDPQSNIGIGHTRWATHGGKTDMNAHPHQDNAGRIALVHNGIIENYYELKAEVQDLGYILHSQTDTEIIAVLIGRYLDENATMNEAIQKTVQRLLGTWALAIIHQDFPNKMWITRNGSPLLLGIEDDYIMVASEHLAFGNCIKRYIVLENHDLIEITNDSGEIKYNKDIRHYIINNKAEILVETQPTGYQHWMMKEIAEQPASIIRAMNNGGRIESNVSVKLGGLDTYKDQLINLNHLIILGCGTSYHAGQWSMDIFKALDIFDTIGLYDGADFQMKDIPKKGKTGLILLSQSGETKDLHRCINIAKEYDLLTMGVVNVVDSLIARETNCGVYLNAGREVAVASTKSFTNQCIVLSMIAVWFSQNRGTCLEKRRKIIADIRNLPIQMGKIMEKDQSLYDDIKSRFSLNSAFILGKGPSYSVALEGALKIKEVAYIHAEGYSTSALKHGPFALIEPGTPIILLDLDEETRDKTQNAFQEILARGAYIIRIVDYKMENRNSANVSIIEVDKNKTYGSLLANCIIQLLSYYLALSREYNPDFPRNLAKVVTVE
jgi:glucosamine--fructose-6-phosphate aminotransferase (isomerizing)